MPTNPERRPVLTIAPAAPARTGAAVALYRSSGTATLKTWRPEMKHRRIANGWLRGYVYSMVRNKPAQELFEPAIVIDRNLPPARVQVEASHVVR